MKASARTLLFLSFIIGFEVSAQEFLAPHNLTLGTIGQYSEKLKVVFKDAYSKNSTLQVMIRSGSPEKVIYIKETEAGYELLTAAASTRVYDVDIKDNWEEIERDRGSKIQGVDQLQSLSAVEDIKVTVNKRDISQELYSEIKSLWRQELMSVRRDSGGKTNLTLDGANYDYSLRLSRLVFISGTARDGASPRLDKLANIARNLSLLVDGKMLESTVIHDISIFKQMPAQ